MSNASKTSPEPGPEAYSKYGNRVVIAVPTEWSGRKPCYSTAREEATAGQRQKIKIFIKIWYQILVTKIGRKLAGNTVSRSGFGIAVSSEVRKRGSKPSSSTDYRAAVIQDAKAITRSTIYSTPTCKPNTPGAL